VLNAAPSAPLTQARDELLAAVDVLVVNEHELRDASGIDDLDDAVDAISGRVPALVVTLGADGCLVAMSSERVRVPAVPAHAVDTTGAGDTFCGVLAASLSSSSEQPLGLDRLVAAARAGSAAAAIAVCRPGAQEAVPTSAEVAALLAPPVEVANAVTPPVE
jgi:ribokinase